MKPMKISYATLLKIKKQFYLFLAYLISKQYVANFIVLITITLDNANWLW